MVLTWRLKAIDCVNFATSFMGKEEYLRALKWFEQAMDFERNFQQLSSANIEAEEHNEAENSSEAHRYAMDNFDADEVKLHVMECLFKTQQYLRAIECFEATNGDEKEQQRGGDETARMRTERGQAGDSVRGGGKKGKKRRKKNHTRRV